ncbi:MAG: hypothetical protein WBG70_10885 [Spirulinaceae cyanobacterium]
MKKIISYFVISSLIFVVGEGYINNPVASQNISNYEPLEYDPPNPPNTGSPSGGKGSRTIGVPR